MCTYGKLHRHSLEVAITADLSLGIRAWTLNFTRARIFSKCFGLGNAGYCVGVVWMFGSMELKGASVMGPDNAISECPAGSCFTTAWQQRDL